MMQCGIMLQMPKIYHPTGVLHTHLKSLNYVGKVEAIFRLGDSVTSSVDAMSLTIKKFAVSNT